jgi:flagellar export protein FliJ
MHSDRLQRIIELKERLMEERELVLDQHNKQRDIICSNIKQVETEIDVNYAELCTRCLDGNEFSLLKDYLEHLGRLKTEALTRKDLIQKKIVEIRAELVEMLREIKVLDTLKERTLSMAKRAQNKKHQKLLDEIALRLESRKT